jgi:hypothetical protein
VAAAQDPISVVFGRAGDCDVTVPESSVSGRHARLSWDASTIVVEDLGSANGTWVDGERVERAVIKVGQDVRLGRTPLPWGDPRLRPFLRRGGIGDTIMAMPRFGRYRCPSCKKLGVLPPGFQRGEISCPSCNTGLVFGTSAKRSIWPSVLSAIATLAVAGVAAAYFVTSPDRVARVQQIVRDVRQGSASGVIPETPDGTPLPPSETPGGPSDEEEAIRVNDVPAVLAAIDSSNATTRDLAVQVASASSGEFNVEQVADIWTYVRVRWRYVNDPRGRDYFARASETIGNGFAGDCDDFATTLAAMTQAIGGNPRVVLMDGPGGGHAYTELCVDLPPDEIAHRLQTHFRAHWDHRLGRQVVHRVSYRSDTTCQAWLNLDWSAPVPGGPYNDETWAVAIFTDGHTLTLTPAQGEPDAGH